MRQYGAGGPKALAHKAEKKLARLYWYIVEFGLINTNEGLRAFGAGMLSSKDETIYSVVSKKPNRIGFDLARILQTKYMVDDFQKTYFVIDSFEQLFEICGQDFAPIYAALEGKEPIEAHDVIDGDDVIQRGAF